MTVATEHELRFACFGGTASVRASAADPVRAGAALERARAFLLGVHDRLTRFEPASELSRLNADPRARVPASPLLRRFAQAVAYAGALSDGLVDATVLPAVQAAGYAEHLDPAAPGLRATLAPRDHDWTADGAWRRVGADAAHVLRPVGAQLDSGGLGKGLAADLAGELLTGQGVARRPHGRSAGPLDDLPAWIVDCGGDLRLGGTAGVLRTIEVADPFRPEVVLHRFQITRGAVATSGTTRRAWATTGPDATAHHLIDPRTGKPARTGVVQATALAPTALEAEVRAKTALLLGPVRARRALPYGGAFVTTDGELHVVARPGRVVLRRAA